MVTQSEKARARATGHKGHRGQAMRGLANQTEEFRFSPEDTRETTQSSLTRLRCLGLESLFQKHKALRTQTHSDIETELLEVKLFPNVLIGDQQQSFSHTAPYSGLNPGESLHVFSLTCPPTRSQLEYQLYTSFYNTQMSVPDQEHHACGAMENTMNTLCFPS